MSPDSTSTIVTCLWLICTSVAIIGSAYAGFAAILLGRFFAKSPAAEPIHTPSVTILKPLCGAEPELEANLASFCNQIYPGQVRIVLGIQDSADPAATTAKRLMSAFPHAAIDLEINAQSHGANPKISNVLNSISRSAGEIVVLSDSDIRVGPAYLRQITAALQAPGVGLVTCLYRGLPIGGVWSRLASAEIDHRFLPNVLVGMTLGLARPCFGSTIALRAETLRQIGGFEAFADQLVDDYAVGAAVRRLGLKVAIPPLVVDHVHSERSFAELARHELRWARTIRLVDPTGYAGSVATYPLPFALAAAALRGFGVTSLAILGLVLACGLFVPLQFGRSLGRRRLPLWLAPVRDLLSFAIFLASFLPWRVTWRGRRYKVGPDGTLTPA
jgi:ceramide glucosyltransferase